jgi:uncharacterized RDD family membrane protein YckC
LQKAEKKIIKKSGAVRSVAPGFFRRMAAVCYDALLLLAVLFLATALVLPFNAGQAFTSDQFFYPLYLLTVSFIFYGWFWTHGGQTLGLRAWKIKLCRVDGGSIGWGQAGLRFAAAGLSWLVFGIGFLWCIFDKNQLCWHDYLSKTRLCMLEQENPGCQKGM